MPGISPWPDEGSANSTPRTGVPSLKRTLPSSDSPARVSVSVTGAAGRPGASAAKASALSPSSVLASTR